MIKLRYPLDGLKILSSALLITLCVLFVLALQL